MKNKSLEESLMKKMGKKIGKGLALVSLVALPVTYPIYSKIGQEVATKLSPPLSQQDAIEYLEKEKESLGISTPTQLEVYEDDDKPSFYAYACRFKEGGHRIGINKSKLKKTILNHEIYHVYRDLKEGTPFQDAYCKDSVREDLEYLAERNERMVQKKIQHWYTFVAEPRADLYSFTKIKL
ncbi:MAG: hypothetical protein WDZ69_00130 [Candidatus Pacearchaeota archaeon]